MRVVLDANVLIAAIATRGLCEAVLEICLQHHDLVLCPGILDEVEGKLGGKLKLPAPLIRNFLGLLRNHSHMVDPEAVPPDACRDPKDLMVLGLVEPGRVEVIVSGEKDLLSIGTFKTARIQNPRGFWESLGTT